MEFRRGSLDFSLPLSGSGPRTASTTLVFSRPVLNAAVGLTGYSAAYSGSDHHVGRLDVQVGRTVNNNTVTVNGTFGVRDWSGNWDDAYQGSIDFAVVAELESATVPPTRRSDLTITGVELNQAVQFFRANTFLDPLNVQPDNSIFLIARKNTGILVYVDWDNTAGLPAIGTLSGNLTVRTGSNTLTLNPINPGGGIVPRRDSNINPAIANHTLNFMIPAAQSVGTVEITCEVFDQATPNLRSGAFTRTLLFVPVDPLNIFLVGVALTTPVAAAAPTQAAIATAMSILNKAYPRGDIQVVGFTTITFTQNIIGCPSSGCGSGWGGLLDQLSDMRGGSGDIYLGGLPAGVAIPQGACVIGCAPLGGGVASAFIDLPLTIPHEIGHAMGRRHAPCAGCSPAAQDPDPNFPQYGSFNSDSIGVFGFDPATNTVFNPANTLDFMTAFLPAIGWISPYTYAALRGNAIGVPVPMGCKRPGAMTNMLFLRLEISRDREVSVEASFNHTAPLQGGGCRTEFTAEFQDKERRVLDCAHLSCSCTGSDCHCWPKRIRMAMAFPCGASWLVIYEGEKKLHEEPIPEPPKVEIRLQKATPEGHLLTWASLPDDDVWYVVHYYDERTHVWRGVAPRMQDKSLLFPKALSVPRGGLRVRVLATRKISTGHAETRLELPRGGEPVPPTGGTVVLVGVDPGRNDPQKLGDVVTGIAIGLGGTQTAPDNLFWYDEHGREVAHGDEVDLRAFGFGQHVLRLVDRENLRSKAWMIEKTPEGIFYRHAISDPKVQLRHEHHVHPHQPPQPCE